MIYISFILIFLAGLILGRALVRKRKRYLPWEVWEKIRTKNKGIYRCYLGVDSEGSWTTICAARLDDEGRIVMTDIKRTRNKNIVTHKDHP